MSPVNIYIKLRIWKIIFNLELQYKYFIIEVFMELLLLSRKYIFF